MVKREILTSHKQACRRSLLKTKHALLRTIHHLFHGNLLLWRDGSNLVHCSHRWKNLSLGQAPKRPHQEIFKGGLAECEILDYRRKNLSLTETHSVGRKKKNPVLSVHDFFADWAETHGAGCIRTYLPHRSRFFSRHLLLLLGAGATGSEGSFQN